MFQKQVVKALAPQKEKKADHDAILAKYPHLRSDVFQLKSVAFDERLLPRRVQDPCPVTGALPFAFMGEQYRQARVAGRIKTETTEPSIPTATTEQGKRACHINPFVDSECLILTAGTQPPSSAAPPAPIRRDTIVPPKPNKKGKKAAAEGVDDESNDMTGQAASKGPKPRPKPKKKANAASAIERQGEGEPAADVHLIRRKRSHAESVASDRSSHSPQRGDDGRDEAEEKALKRHRGDTVTQASISSSTSRVRNDVPPLSPLASTHPSLDSESMQDDSVDQGTTSHTHSDSLASALNITSLAIHGDPFPDSFVSADVDVAMDEIDSEEMAEAIRRSRDVAAVEASMQREHMSSGAGGSSQVAAESRADAGSPLVGGVLDNDEDVDMVQPNPTTDHESPRLFASPTPSDPAGLGTTSPDSSIRDAADEDEGNSSSSGESSSSALSSPSTLSKDVKVKKQRTEGARSLHIFSSKRSFRRQLDA